MGDKVEAKARDARGRRAARPRNRGRDDARRGARRPPRSSATRCCSRPPRAAAARACGSSSRPTSSRTRSAPRRARPRPRSATAALYVEKALSPARHVEIQVLCDGDGGVLTLGERECSIQRRHQKLIEESPSPALTPELREEMEAAAERACRAIGYLNAGTFEFLLGPDGAFSFIELNARLQVEHPVTELVHRDRPRARAAPDRLRRAAGADGPRAERRGHAIEVRLNAEDPARGLPPAPGTIDRLPAAARPGRAARHVHRGRRRRPAVLRLAARQADRLGRRPRRRDRPRAQRALGELRVEGVPTTRELALDILRSEDFASGHYSTSYLEEAAAALPALAAAG